MFVCMFVCPGFASYTYEVYTYDLSLALDGEQTILVDLQGGMEYLRLSDDSFADIKGTSTLDRGTGGVWYIDTFNNSHLNISGGEVHEIGTGNDATVLLTGGIIQRIWSGQVAWIQEGEPPVWVPNPHITIVCDLDTYFHNETTNLLTGNWLDGSAFSIQLIDIDGKSPAIENIQFVPEPATLLLFGLGGVVLRRRQ